MRVCKTVLCLTIWFSAAVPGYGYPYGLCTIPSAQTVGPRTLLVEFDSSGSTKPLTTDCTTGFLSQYGIGSRFEVGVDRYEGSDWGTTVWNGKMLLFEEGRVMPAVAFGMMDISRDSKPTAYTVLTKSFGPARLHAGWIRASYSRGMMVGADVDLTPSLWLGADYLPGEENYIQFGVGHLVGSASWITLTYARPNESAYSSRQLGLTFSSYIDFCR
jgi:hypothetical protein